MMDTRLDARVSFLLIAESKLGLPYYWGGDGDEEFGTDCSGLFVDVAREQMRYTPAFYDGQRRTAAGIYNYYRNKGCTPFTEADRLAPGCLCFFKSATTGRIFHIQIHCFAYENVIIEEAFSEEKVAVPHGPRGIHATSSGRGASKLNSVARALRQGAAVTPCASGYHGGAEVVFIDPFQLL